MVAVWDIPDGVVHYTEFVDTYVSKKGVLTLVCADGGKLKVKSITKEMQKEIIKHIQSDNRIDLTIYKVQRKAPERKQNKGLVYDVMDMVRDIFTI